jgi:MFS family permease
MPLSITTLLRVFLPFAAAYFLSYIFRVVNAIIAPDLIADIGLGPSELGMLTSIYFISFAFSQLPLGIILDRFGPRRTEAILLLFAGAGALVFSRTETLTGLVVGRALIGFGVSSCLMAAFKAYTLWFPRERWPLINGLQMAAGGLGALTATSPVESVLQLTDWHGLFLLLMLLTFVAAAMVFLIVPERPPAGHGESLHQQLRGIREVFTSIRFWRTAPLTTVTQAAFLSIQGLWAGPWLTHVSGLDRPQTATILFSIATAMVTGFIVMGGLAERFQRRGISLLATAITGICLFMGVQVLIITEAVPWVGPLWLSFGFFGTASIITYTTLSQSFAIQLSGRVTTAVNLLVFVAAFIGQWAIGAIIGLWPVTPAGGFAAAGFKAGFSLMLILQVIALVWFIIASKRFPRDEISGIFEPFHNQRAHPKDSVATPSNRYTP